MTVAALARAPRREIAAAVRADPGGLLASLAFGGVAVAMFADFAMGIYTLNGHPTIREVVFPSVGGAIGANGFAMDSGAGDQLYSPAGVVPFSPTAITGQVKGGMTYADTGTVNQVIPLRWRAGAADYLQWRIRTDGSWVGGIQILHFLAGVGDYSTSATDVYAPGTNVPFSMAVTHTDDFVVGAAEGAALSQDNGVTGIPALGGANLEIGQLFTGDIERVVIWLGDIGAAGRAAVTS